jgi:hypothetical protein
VFLQTLRAQGVRVLTVREILAFGVEERMGARVELEDLAASTLTYRLSEGEQLCGGFSNGHELPPWLPFTFSWTAG